MSPFAVFFADEDSVGVSRVRLPMRLKLVL